MVIFLQEGSGKELYFFSPHTPRIPMVVKKNLILSISWLFKSMGLLSRKDYEHFKFNLPLLNNCEVLK